MSFAVLFAGQGSQHPQMLPWLDDAGPRVQQTQAALGVPDWRAALQDTAWAARNRPMQVLLTGLGLAAWAQIEPALPAPAAVAGYSVGELAAFATAGVFDAGTAIALAAQRAQAMDDAAARHPGGLLAITGLGLAKLEAIACATGTAIAIHIAADAAVLGGPHAGLDAATQQATGHGAKCTRLNVELASHTPAMGAAAEAFAQALARLSLHRPRLPLFCNLTADRVHGGEDAAQALAQQIARPVQWAHCLQAVHDRQVRCVLELGPGTALARMWNQRYPEVPARSADDFRSAKALIGWVLRHAA